MLMLLLACIEIPALIILIIITKIGGAVKETVRASNSKTSPQKQKRTAELSEEQREKIVKAILEDSLLENDSAWDALVFEGEAEYPAADACQISDREFDLQYGSKNWIASWIKTLSRFFDCQTEYVGSGVFRIYGKEA